MYFHLISHMPILRFNLLLNLFRTYFYKKNNLAAVTAAQILELKYMLLVLICMYRILIMPERRIKRVRLHGLYVSSVGTVFTIMNGTQLYLLFPLAEEVKNNVLISPSNCINYSSKVINQAHQLLKVMSLLLKMLSRLIITFLPKRKCLLISWLQSPFAVILETKKIVCRCFHCFPIYLP